MNRIFNIGFLITCSMVLLLSCQSERHEVLTEEEVNLAAGDVFFDLVSRAAMHNGSEDDDVDGSSCFSIQFPYYVLINDMEIKVNSASDLKSLLDRFGEDAFEDLDLLMPLTIQLGNYERVTVETHEQLEAFQEQCEEDVRYGLSPITCAEIDFPIQLFVYNTESQKTNSANIANKQQLFVFLKNIGANEILSFDYPITLRFLGQSEFEIRNRNEFQSALETCTN